MTEYNAFLQRLIDTRVQALLRVTTAKIQREAKLRAEYEPIIREAAVQILAQVAENMLKDDGAREALIEAICERHSTPAPFASELADTALSVLSSWVAEIKIVTGDGR